MSAQKREQTIGMRVELANALVAAARDDRPIAGLTHSFYRYPARFSPTLVRALIEVFSEPGDLVLDPFMGGGTTLVEALALGRHSVGTDISSLATFVSEVKTTLYEDYELASLEKWAARTAQKIGVGKQEPKSNLYSEAGYYRNLAGPQTWRLRKVISQALAAAADLPTPRLEQLARCVVLRTGQWALDGRRQVPKISAFRETLVDDASHIACGARELRQVVESHKETANVVVNCINRSSDGLENEPLLHKRKPSLVVTSPPYPGIHVLYHRWQVDGRKETSAPFWIANKLDGSGSSHYTMGDRKAFELHTYFSSLRRSLNSIAAICNSDTMVVQVVAFSEPKWQLPRYMKCAEEAGLVEQFLPHGGLGCDRRLWRTVPNRKWHANQKGATSGSQEVVLFHRLNSVG